MIEANIIIDKRNFAKSKGGYPLKIYVYDNVLKKKGYINLKSYQQSETLQRSIFVKQRESQIITELDYINLNRLDLDNAIEILKNGIPESDLLRRKKLLEFELRQIEEQIGSGVGVLEFYEIFLEERKKKNLLTESYHNGYAAIKKFIYPEPDFPMNNINYDWINSFVQFTIDRGLTQNTASSYLSYLRAVYKECQRREVYNIKSDNPFSGLKPPIKRKVSYELSPEDLKAILNFDPNKIKHRSSWSSYELKRWADLFMFQFTIGGHDFIEICNMKWSMIKNGRIRFKRFKNRFKPNEGVEVNTKLFPFALEVIKKYGTKDNERVFSFLPDPELSRKEYDRFVVKTNKYQYGIIARSCGIKEEIRSKAPRYIFRTFAGNLMMNELVVMTIQGHSPRGMTFRYQGSLEENVIDAEHKKVLDLVFTDC